MLCHVGTVEPKVLNLDVTDFISITENFIMQGKYNKKMAHVAQSLRKRMTKEERHLWYDFLRSYFVKFYRQRAISNYIVDFYCPAAKLVVELDGSQHFEDKNIREDTRRTEELKKFGLFVLRIPNNEVNNNFVGVCEYIDLVVKARIDSLGRIP